MTKPMAKAGPGFTAPDLPVRLLVLLSPFACGLFYEPLSALASLYLIGYLLYCRKKAGSLSLPVSPALIATLALAACYAASPLWGVDHGMAVYGFVRFLPLPLFVFACGQISGDKRAALVGLLPYAGAVMTVLSALLALVPALRGFFLVSGRLAGFFQYPNTFAAYLLLGVPVLAERGPWRARQLLCLALLMLGIALSGSRTVMALLVLTVVYYSVVLRGAKKRAVLPAALILTLAAAALYARASGGGAAAGRYLTASAGSSTFLGRLLYFRDALPVILRHPFGLGYLGYYYTQGAFQTGVYSVVNIHNDLLQFLLDVGWLPAALLVWAVVKSFFAPSAARERRVMLLILLAHCMFDFDLQFAAMDLTLLLVMDSEGKSSLRLKKTPARVLGGALAAACVYFGLASSLYYLGAPEAAAAVYPGHTQALTALLTEAEDADAMDELADSILARNDSVSLAWSARARAAYARGDIGAMIDAKRRAIALSKYELSEYLDYLDMLFVGIRLYGEAGDAASAEYCRQAALEVPDMLEDVLAGTSRLGWRIADRPELTLPDEYAQALAALG